MNSGGFPSCLAVGIRGILYIVSMGMGRGDWVTGHCMTASLGTLRVGKFGDVGTLRVGKFGVGRGDAACRRVWGWAWGHCVSASLGAGVTLRVGEFGEGGMGRGEGCRFCMREGRKMGPRPRLREGRLCARTRDGAGVGTLRVGKFGELRKRIHIVVWDDSCRS